MVNKKTVDFRIKPYVQEATLQIVLDIIIMGLVSFVLVLANFSLLAYVIVGVSYFIAALIFHYKVVIQAVLDKIKKRLYNRNNKGKRVWY